jgi:hypothetical protein
MYEFNGNNKTKHIEGNKGFVNRIDKKKKKVRSDSMEIR